MGILADRGGGWRGISSTNNVGYCRGSTGDIRRLARSTARKGWEPLPKLFTTKHSVLLKY